MPPTPVPRAPDRRLLPFLAARLLAVLLLAALPGTFPATAQTSLQVKGSDTIGGELGPDLARAFEAASPGVEVDWEGLGSGTAFVGLFDGSADLGASSRAIRASEIEEARRLGLRLEEFVLGYDGIAVLVHPSNPVERLTLGQLAAIFRGEVDDWGAVGGAAGSIRRISRPNYSGTHGFFKKAVLDDEDFAADTVFIEHSEDIVAQVAATPGAISYLGMGWIRSGVKPVAVAPAAGEEAVLPSGKSVRAGTYPIYRPLLLYTRGEPTGMLRELMAFILGPTGQRIVERNEFIRSDAPCTLCDTPAPRRQADTGRDIELYRVFFTYGGARLDAEAQRVLGRVAELLAAGDRRALITGHADADGSPQQNRAVSLARARAVARYLVRQGVPVDLLTVEGRGAEEPIGSNEEPAGRDRNRRADVRLLPR